ncbi:unnamed protein product, partial [Rotaria sp. Silwood2]
GQGSTSYQTFLLGAPISPSLCYYCAALLNYAYGYPMNNYRRNSLDDAEERFVQETYALDRTVDL